MGQPIPNGTNGSGRFRFINISVTSRLKVALDQTPRFGLQVLLQLIEVRSSYFHYNALVEQRAFITELGTY